MMGQAPPPTRSPGEVRVQKEPQLPTCSHLPSVSQTYFSEGILREGKLIQKTDFEGRLWPLHARGTTRFQWRLHHI